MWEEIGSNVFASFGSEAETNSFLLVGKKVALIDTGLKQNARQLKEGLSSIGLTPRDVEFVFHTHGHADNIGLDYLFSKAEVWMHPADTVYVHARDEMFSLTERLELEKLKWPQVHKTFEDKQVFDLGNFQLQTIFTPGHTKGSVSFMEQNQKWLFCGDTLFSTGLGRWDLVSGNKSQVISSARKILFSSPKMIFPGHGLPLRARGSASIARQLERLMVEEVPEAFI
jgi:glyoxylase-like metal-dependent hydrolase (beta-lactamase superfamily II)